MSDFQKDLEDLRKIRQSKYSKESLTHILKPEYNYGVRKDSLDYLKKVSKFESIREQLDKIEKQELKNKFGKIQKEDLEYLEEMYSNEYFITELFRHNFNHIVLSEIFYKTNFVNFSMIKDILLKSKITELFILDMVKAYTQINKNYIQIITTTNLLDTKFNRIIDYVMKLFYNPINTSSISYDQLKFICSKTDITPDKLKFLISICSNKSGYSKCEKTGIERTNVVLLKNLIRDIELKFKCKIDVGFM
jgi:hypothetical protein